MDCAAALSLQEADIAGTPKNGVAQERRPKLFNPGSGTRQSTAAKHT
ncbi:hypothetical protein NOR53_86 [gamma proteobacterium NOR5-3]|nr:hypothetical protein NOR53_86 [gamma proteobacterium NOR5-3]